MPFIVQDCFGYPGFLAFPYEVEYHSFEVFEAWENEMVEMEEGSIWEQGRRYLN